MNFVIFSLSLHSTRFSQPLLSPILYVGVNARAAGSELLCCPPMFSFIPVELFGNEFRRDG